MPFIFFMNIAIVHYSKFFNKLNQLWYNRPMQQTILEIKNLSKSYGEITALANFSLNLGKGEVLGLLGPNGAGKTTLIGILSGTLRDFTGTVAFKGQDLFGDRRLRNLHRHRPAGDGFLRRPGGAGKPDVLGRPVRHPGKGTEAPGAGAAGAGGAGRPGQGAGQEILGRHEAAAEHRHRPDPPARAAAAGRADGGHRRPGQGQHPGHHPQRGRAGDLGHLHHPPAVRGGADLHAHRHHGQGGDPGRKARWPS